MTDAQVDYLFSISPICYRRTRDKPLGFEYENPVALPPKEELLKGKFFRDFCIIRFESYTLAFNFMSDERILNMPVNQDTDPSIHISL